MVNTIYELAWIFFIYSFIGWCGEVIVAAVNRHKFVNRGFIAGPLCPIYGPGAVAVAVFLPELKENLIFLCRRNDRYFVRRIYYGKADGKDTA
ncbi:MAG: putative ABC transporter permease [[Ruminococcus] torques]|uniref:putative ABC transporter permease n=1 Tax=[Ruminococcus] torques TaxID=33039 RepID=UPI0039F9917C